jgi:hypothetical protein
MKEGERIRDGRVEAVILPTKERCAKRIDGDRDIVIVESPRGGGEARSFSFPLDYYLRKEMITRKQWLAGDQLFELYVEGTLPGHVQFRYRESNGNARVTAFTPPGAFATKYRDAIMSIRGLKARKVTFDVCCEGITLVRSKRFKSKWDAKREGMSYLLEGLDDLIDHFRY